MNYKSTLEQAIIYIENHLEEDIKVADVAHFAGYSYYHLNRQFIAIIGESVGSYIKKRRLSNAAHKLLYTDNKVIDIAMENNFESPEAFSRAFKAMYKVSPQDYRKNRIQTFVSIKDNLDKNLLNHLLNHVTVHPKIVEIDEIKVVGLRSETELNPIKIKQLWKQFYENSDEIPNCVSNKRYFGIYESCDENIYFTINQEMIMNEVLGTEVTSFKDVDKQYITKIISGGYYAVFTHHGSLETISQTLDYIWGTWLFSTKEELDTREILELYDDRFLGYSHPHTEIDIYIPIKHDI